MKNSSLFTSRSNYQIKSKKQYIKELKHIIRYIEKQFKKGNSRNVNIDKSYLNKFYFYENGERLDLSTLEPQILLDKLLNHLEEMKDNYKSIHHNSKDEQEKIRQLKDQRRNTINRLKGKDLSLEEFEESGLKAKDYIDIFWSKEYKSEKMTERMKKRTLESLENYLKIKDNNNKKDKSMQLTSHHTMFQEFVFKIPIGNGVDFTDKEMNTIIDKQVKKEKDRRNEVLFVAIHNDESSKHRHIIIKNNDFKLVQNQQEDILKKFNLDYDLKNMTDEQLKHIGELEQLNDRDIINESMQQDIHFDLISNINKNITNKERQERNKLMNKKHKYSNNIDNREFNYINLENEKLFNNLREFAVEKLTLVIEKMKLLKLQKSIKLQRNFKPLNIRNKRKKTHSLFKRKNRENSQDLEFQEALAKLRNQDLYIENDNNIEIIKKMNKQINENGEVSNFMKYRELQRQLEKKEVTTSDTRKINILKKIQNNEKIKEYNQSKNQVKTEIDYNEDNDFNIEK